MTFNEKVAWRKLYQRNPTFPIFSDKIAVKEEIAKIVGEEYVIKTLWSGNSPDDIPFDRLTTPYVIKVSHNSGGNIFVSSEHDVKKKEIIHSVNRQLKYSHGYISREWGYFDIPRRVLVEPMIKTPQGGIPEDYKFYTYHGRVHFIQVDFDRFKSHTRNLYDRDWNLLPVELFRYPRSSKLISKPSNLEKMIVISENIGQMFDFVRVDLYSLPQGVLFGEVAFYPSAGYGYFPEGWDLRFGEPWKIWQN